MPINKSATAPNGAPINYHVITHVTVEFTATQKAKAVINHYADAPEPGSPSRVLWQDTYEIALEAIAGPDVKASVEAWMISTEGLFSGGTIAEIATPVEKLRAELLVTAASRRKELRKVYVHDFGGEVGEVPFDADEASAGNINAVLTAGIIASLPPEFVVNYKCADDTYREFSLAQFQSMALGMLAFVQDLHTRESELIEEIAAAEDDAEALIALAPVVKTFTRPAPLPEEEE